MITGLIWSEIKQLWDMGLKDYVSELSTFNILQMFFVCSIWFQLKYFKWLNYLIKVSDMWNVVDFITNSLYVATIGLRLRAYYDVTLISSSYCHLVILSTKYQTIIHIILSSCHQNIKTSNYHIFIISSCHHVNKISNH